jgi:hypothetical protein
MASLFQRFLSEKLGPGMFRFSLYCFRVGRIRCYYNGCLDFLVQRFLAFSKAYLGENGGPCLFNITFHTQKSSPDKRAQKTILPNLGLTFICSKPLEGLADFLGPVSCR